MKTERNILIAFLLNLSFSIFEFIGSMFTGSIAIASDAVHDIGDAISIGLSFFFEKKSKRQPDEVYTYGYSRYSALGGAITTLVLILGSVIVICSSVGRIIQPCDVDSGGMIILALIGIAVNLCAAFFTRSGESLNQKAVNLHMLEDVLGWGIVLCGAIAMRFTDFSLIDPIMSVGVAVFILVNAVRNLIGVLNIFLEKSPDGIDTSEIKEHIMALDGVLGVHHIHIWSLDTQNNYATMHVITNGEPHAIKHLIRDELNEHGIVHATLELESEGEHCHAESCELHFSAQQMCHHHHHH